MPDYSFKRYIVKMKNGGQRAEVRGRRGEMRNAECGGQRTEDRRRRAEGTGRRGENKRS